MGKFPPGMMDLAVNSREPGVTCWITLGNGDDREIPDVEFRTVDVPAIGDELLVDTTWGSGVFVVEKRLWDFRFKNDPRCLLTVKDVGR